MKKPLRTLPPACGASLSRRSAVRQVGGWAIYLGAVTVAACGRTPLGDPLGGFLPGDDDDDVATTPTVTLTPTPTPAACTCLPVAGAAVGLNRTDVPLNAFAVNGGQAVFICHDALGFYAMSDVCTHASTHIIVNGSFNPGNLSAGFTCGSHGSTFNGEGAQTGIPAPAGSFLTHFLLTVDGAGDLFLDKAVIVDHTCRCT